MKPARAVALALALAACGGPPPNAPLVQVTIPPGATLRAISESLSAHQVLDHPRWFRTLARLERNDRKAQAGIYELRRGERAGTLLRILTEGRGKLVRFTVPEGSTVREVAALAAEAIGLPADSVLAATADTGRLHAVGGEGPSYEGWLHPDTYLVPLTIPPERPGRPHGAADHRAVDPGARGPPRLDAAVATRRADAGVDRGGGGAGGRGAAGHRGGLPEPAPAPHAAAGGSDGPVRDGARHRRAQAAAVHPGLQVSVTLQHLPEAGAPARPDRLPGDREHRRRARRRPACRISTSWPDRTGGTSFPAPTASTSAPSSRCAPAFRRRRRSTEPDSHEERGMPRAYSRAARSTSSAPRMPRTTATPAPPARTTAGTSPASTPPMATHGTPAGARRQTAAEARQADGPTGIRLRARAVERPHAPVVGPQALAPPPPVSPPTPRATNPGGAMRRAIATGRSSGPRCTPAAPVARATSNRSLTKSGTRRTAVSARAATGERPARRRA